MDNDNAEIERYRREQAGAYLRRVRDAKRHISALNSEIDDLRALASGLTGIDYSRDAVSASPNADRIPDAVAKLVDVVRERVDLVDGYAGMLEECGASLRELNGIYADILRYRYLCDTPWELIATKTNYSERWLYELHDRALAAFYPYMPAHERDPLPRAL